jgi:hypothetical protein
MNECLACLLAAELQCNDCRRPLCEGCVKWYSWEENDYSGDSVSEDDGGSYLTFDIELCKACYDKH